MFIFPQAFSYQWDIWRSSKLNVRFKEEAGKDAVLGREERVAIILVLWIAAKQKINVLVLGCRNFPSQLREKDCQLTPQL